MGGAQPPEPQRYWLSTGSGRFLIGSIPNNGQVSLKRQCLGLARAAQSPAALSFRVLNLLGLAMPGRGLARVRAPAAVLLWFLTQKAKARQSCPPSPRPPPPSLLLGRRGREGGEQEDCPRGGGEGECWAALAPGGAPRGSRARDRPAPKTEELAQLKCMCIHNGQCDSHFPPCPPFPPPRLH